MNVATLAMGYTPIKECARWLATLFVARILETTPFSDNPRWSRRAHHIEAPYQVFGNVVGTVLGTPVTALDQGIPLSVGD